MLRSVSSILYWYCPPLTAIFHSPKSFYLTKTHVPSSKLSRHPTVPSGPLYCGSASRQAQASVPASPFSLTFYHPDLMQPLSSPQNSIQPCPVTTILPKRIKNNNNKIQKCPKMGFSLIKHKMSAGFTATVHVENSLPFAYKCDTTLSGRTIHVVRWWSGSFSEMRPQKWCDESESLNTTITATCGFITALENYAEHGGSSVKCWRGEGGALYSSQRRKRHRKTGSFRPMGTTMGTTMGTPCFQNAKVSWRLES